ALLRNFAFIIAEEFSTPLRPDDIWDPRLGDIRSLTKFVEQGVLKRAKTPVVLCLDEVDRVFSRPYRNDFFSALRAWHDQRAVRPAWTNLTLVIAHSTDPASWIDDVRQSPFNVGERLWLSDFSREQVAALNARHGKVLRDAAQLDGFYRLVGGQPYLVRQGLY